MERSHEEVSATALAEVSANSQHQPPRVSE